MKKLYWKMYQDKESTENFCNFVILTKEKMMEEIKGHFDEYNEECFPPVFEPVMMTEIEFNNQPEFEGY